VEDGESSTAVVSHVDVVRTVTDLLGLPAMSRASDGLSLAEDLTRGGGVQSGRSWAWVGATQRGPMQYAFRSEHYKIIHYPNGERPDEVYDLRTDPGEQHDLAGSQIPDVVEAMGELRRRLAEARELPMTETIDLDAQTREKLEALGYLDGH
jgi:arylsulfatase A-like enzyme